MFTVNEFLKNSLNKSDLGNLTFLNYLKTRWDEIHETNDVFRYRIDDLEEKVVGGYVLQLNPDRNTKRRQPENIGSIFQPFDKDKFNFTKAHKEEVICTLKDSENDSDIHSILVNVSPVSRYHSLLCPSVNKCLPQVATKESLSLAIQLMFSARDRAFRIGFNSLCGFASVNHLHYHFFIEENILPVEKAKCDHVQGPVYCLTKDYPVQAFCFELVSEDMEQAMSKEIYKLIEHLLRRSIAHNIFMTRGSSASGADGEVLRVLVWPRRSSGIKHLMMFNVAVLELSGWFPVYDADAYKNLQPADLESELKKWSIDNFDNLCKEIKELY